MAICWFCGRKVEYSKDNHPRWQHDCSNCGVDRREEIDWKSIPDEMCFRLRCPYMGSEGRCEYIFEVLGESLKPQHGMGGNGPWVYEFNYWPPIRGCPVCGRMVFIEGLLRNNLAKFKEQLEMADAPLFADVAVREGA